MLSVALSVTIEYRQDKRTMLTVLRFRLELEMFFESQTRVFATLDLRHGEDARRSRPDTLSSRPLIIWSHATKFGVPKM